ncbi:hypothetical protein N322_05384, partial [Cariama cristata]
LLKCTKDEPESPADEDHVAGVLSAARAMPHADRCFPPLPTLDFPGETSPGMGRGNQVVPVATAALGSPGTAAMSEQPAAGEEASDASVHGGSFRQHPDNLTGGSESRGEGLLPLTPVSLQAPQRALLESLASDTVSHLHFLSHSLVQVGETLHQLLLRPQTHPGPLGHYVPHVPLFEGSPGVPCSPSTPHTSPDHKEE